MITDHIILAIEPAVGSETNSDSSLPAKCSSKVYHSWKELMESAPHHACGSTLLIEIGLPADGEKPGGVHSTTQPGTQTESVLATADENLEIEPHLASSYYSMAGVIGSEFQQLSQRMCSLERAQRFREHLNELSLRQRDVLTLILQGQSCKEIAARLDVGLATAAKHRARIFKKLCVRNVVELVQLLNATFGRTPLQALG